MLASLARRAPLRPLAGLGALAVPARRLCQGSVIDGSITLPAEQFDANKKRMDELIDRLRGLTATVAQGGGERSVAIHRKRNKMLPRERIAALLDVGSPFLELSPLAAHEVYGSEEVPSAGIVTGVGAVQGRLCMIVCNDATVKGGTYYPITVKKHLRAQEVATENRLPCIYLVDSGGANLPRQAEHSI